MVYPVLWLYDTGIQFRNLIAGKKFHYHNSCSLAAQSFSSYSLVPGTSSLQLSDKPVFLHTQFGKKILELFSF